MARKTKVIATIDAETDPFKYEREPSPFCWGFYDGDTYQDFWGENCTEQLVEYLQDVENIVIYAHNGGKFDFFFLLPYLDQDFLLINGRIAKATMFNGRIELRDSWLILPLSLSQYEKDEIDYALFEKEKRNNNKKEILKYLRSDCIYLHEWVSKFISEFGNGLTLAGAAFKQLKKTGYEIGKSFDDYDTRFRQYYYGGRVQCFEVGAFKGAFKMYDINSAYPEAMLNRHWWGTQYIEHVRLPPFDNGSWFAEIVAVSRGALPHRGEDGKLYFADDGIARKYFATGHEIIAGVETGTLDILETVKSYRPLFTESFEEYVNKFYKLKDDAKANGDKALYLFAKLMLNAAYGKFGQDGRKFEKFCICEFGEWPEGDGWLPYSDTPTGQRIFSRPDPQESFFNVATAASITGSVRAKLWRALCASDRPMYCDTDSIMCENSTVPLGKKIGEWELEIEPTEIYIAQRKMYAVRDAEGKTKTASKGVRLSFEQIAEGVISGRNITSYRDAPAYSLKYGARFFSRETNFSEIYKKKC